MTLPVLGVVPAFAMTEVIQFSQEHPDVGEVSPASQQTEIKALGCGIDQCPGAAVAKPHMLGAYNNRHRDLLTVRRPEAWNQSVSRATSVHSSGRRLTASSFSWWPQAVLGLWPSHSSLSCVTWPLPVFVCPPLPIRIRVTGSRAWLTQCALPSPAKTLFPGRSLSEVQGGHEFGGTVFTPVQGMTRQPSSGASW